MLDKREKDSRAFIVKSMKSFEARLETNMVRKYEELKRLSGT